MFRHWQTPASERSGVCIWCGRYQNIRFSVVNCSVVRMLPAIQNSEVIKKNTKLDWPAHSILSIKKKTVSRRRHQPNVKPDRPAAAFTSISMPGSRGAQHEPKIVYIVVTVLMLWDLGLCRQMSGFRAVSCSFITYSLLITCLHVHYTLMEVFDE